MNKEIDIINMAIEDTEFIFGLDKKGLITKEGSTLIKSYMDKRELKLKKIVDKTELEE